MKKFIYHLFCYIGLTLFLFNPSKSFAETNNIPLPFDNELTSWSTPDNDNSFVKQDNEFVKMMAAFMLADKLFPDKKINDDITGFLHRMWPTTDIEKLKKFSYFIKMFVMVKRRYVYATDSLKHKIKAAGILPKDTPIVAKDGEYAPAYSDERKKTAPNTYKVKYVPYKYLEYDKGEYGEPVRRRDKNYEPVEESTIDEITLALLQFNLRDLVLAIKKLPVSNDGTREKAVDLENGVKSRILLDLVGLGKEETVKAVMEVYVPKGWYINGDFLNQASKPKFFLSEDKNQDLNIKEYQLFYPDAAGIVHNGKAHRVWIGSIKFPITFTRRDVYKGLNIKGSFVFQLCDQKTNKCHPVVSQNSLSIPPSEDRLPSLHTNFVSSGFAQLPQQNSRHAKLKAAYYNPNTKKLTVTFDTTKKFSNMAVMAEDSAKTSFLKPQYNINSKELSVTFDTEPLTAEERTELSPIDDDGRLENGGEIAVTAAFDEYELMRTTVKPEIIYTKTAEAFIPEIKYTTAFLFGFILNLMPALLYMLQRLLQFLTEKEDRRRILLRYMFGTAIGMVLWTTYNRFHPWYAAYESAWLNITALVLAVSYITAMLGYMNFDLFRPLKGIVRRGLSIGLLTILLAAAAPLPLKASVLNMTAETPLFETIKIMFCVWIGLLILPCLCLAYHKYLIDWPYKLQFFNLPCTIVYALILLIISFGTRGWLGLIIALIVTALTGFLWYLYPMAITETVKYRRSHQNKAILFDKVQRHGAIIISIIWLCGCITTALISPKDQNVPLIEEVQTEATQNIQNNKATLFVLMQNWSLFDIYMQKSFEKLQINNIEVKQYKISAQNKEAIRWLKTYNRNYPPLTILFTSRHPQGLAMPTDLDHIDWKEALSVFQLSTEQKKDTEQ